MSNVSIKAICVLIMLLSNFSWSACQKGEKAADVKIVKWMTESKVNLNALEGKVYLFEFWATWCPPCRKSIPHLNELCRKYSKDGLVVVGLAQDKKPYVVSNFLKRTQVCYPIACDSETCRNYQVNAFPTIVLVDANGYVVWRGHNVNSQLETAIKKALAKVPKPAAEKTGAGDLKNIKLAAAESLSFATILNILQQRGYELDFAQDRRNRGFGMIEKSVFANRLDTVDDKTAVLIEGYFQK